MATNTIYSITHHHRRFYEEFQVSDAVGVEEKRDRQQLFATLQEKLFISEKDIKAIKARSVSLDGRLRNEINLVRVLYHLFIHSYLITRGMEKKAYHVVTQNNAQLSIDIAQIARRDNATMKALALIGVLYLPGTFISGIFGSNFFNYSPSSNSGNLSNGSADSSVSDWNMSEEFWIYWVITIPVTLFTVLLWAMLDETMAVYESVFGRVIRGAFGKLWSRLLVEKQLDEKREHSTSRYRTGEMGEAV